MLLVDTKYAKIVRVYMNAYWVAPAKNQSPPSGLRIATLTEFFALPAPAKILALRLPFGRPSHAITLYCPCAMRHRFGLALVREGVEGNI
jgi:hypothetical protein